MVRCNLSVLMGQKKLNIAELARDTGVHRNSITLLYKEQASRVELDVVEKLCRYFNCSICDLFEIVDD